MEAGSQFTGDGRRLLRVGAEVQSCSRNWRKETGDGVPECECGVGRNALICSRNAAELHSFPTIGCSVAVRRGVASETDLVTRADALFTAALMKTLLKYCYLRSDNDWRGDAGHCMMMSAMTDINFGHIHRSRTGICAQFGGGLRSLPVAEAGGVN